MWAKVMWPFNKKSKIDPKNFSYKANGFNIVMSDSYLWINGAEFTRDKNEALYTLAVCLAATINELGQR